MGSRPGWTGAAASSQRAVAGFVASSKLTRSWSVLLVKNATPPVLTLSCFSDGSRGAQSTPIDGSPALFPRSGGEILFVNVGATPGSTGATAGNGTRLTVPAMLWPFGRNGTTRIV